MLRSEYHDDHHPDPDHDQLHLDHHDQGMRTLMGTPLQQENAQHVPFTTPMPRLQLSSDHHDHHDDYDDHSDDSSDHHDVHCAC